MMVRSIDISVNISAQDLADLAKYSVASDPYLENGTDLIRPASGGVGISAASIDLIIPPVPEIDVTRGVVGWMRRKVQIVFRPFMLGLLQPLYTETQSMARILDEIRATQGAMNADLVALHDAVDGALKRKDEQNALLLDQIQQRATPEELENIQKGIMAQDETIKGMLAALIPTPPDTGGTDTGGIKPVPPDGSGLSGGTGEGITPAGDSGAPPISPDGGTAG